MIKNKVYPILKRIMFRIPNIYFSFKPIKIYEFKEIIKDVIFSKTDIILDIGCGQGIPAMLIGKKCKKIYGIDVSKRALIIAKMRAYYLRKKVNSEFKHVRLENAKFKKEYFDKIFSICVIEHITNYIEVIKEVYRILKKGGQFLLSADSLETINDEKLLNYHKEKCYVEHYFKKNELKQILKEIGFNKIMIYPIFKSIYAETLYFKYLEAIKSPNSRLNKFKRFLFIYHYILLKYKEFRALNKEKGIYLIAKCYK